MLWTLNIWKRHKQESLRGQSQHLAHSVVTELGELLAPFFFLHLLLLIKKMYSSATSSDSCLFLPPHLHSRMSAKGGPQSIRIMRIAKCDKVRQISSLFRGLGGSSARRRSRWGQEWGRRALAEYVKGQETIVAVSPWKKWCCFVFGSEWSFV